jgi:polysaccharide biosynthesis protein PslH
MRILFLTSRLPYPPDRGDRLRTYQFLRLFAQMHEVTLVSFFTNEMERSMARNLASYCEDMHLLPLPTWKSVANVALNLWRDLPLQTIYYQSRQMEKTIFYLLTSSSFELAYVHLFRMANYLVNYPQIYRVLDLTDLISYEIQSSIPYQPIPWRYLYQIESQRIARYEKQIASQFDETWFISQRDLDLFMEEGPQVNSWIVPNSIDEELFSLRQDSPDPLKLLFVGHLEVRHNIDAVRYMAEKVLPLILKEAPDVQLLIVGAGDKKKVMPLDHLPGVKVLGYVTDLRTVFRQCSIAVAPLRFSAGIQNKVIESMAAGLPVVTTSDVSAGLGTVPERDLLVADEAKGFANQTLRLINDQELQEDLGRAGRAFTKAHFSLRLAIDRLKAIQDQIKG